MFHPGSLAAFPCPVVILLGPMMLRAANKNAMCPRDIRQQPGPFYCEYKTVQAT